MDTATSSSSAGRTPPPGLAHYMMKHFPGSYKYACALAAAGYDSAEAIRKAPFEELRLLCGGNFFIASTAYAWTLPPVPGSKEALELKQKEALEHQRARSEQRAARWRYVQSYLPGVRHEQQATNETHQPLLGHGFDKEEEAVY